MQHDLERLYEVSIEPRVEDYLISDPRLLAEIYDVEAGRNIQETLLVQQQGDDLDLSLYLDAGVLERCVAIDRDGDLKTSEIGDFCIALEGVSHFLYLVWKASRRRSVTLLELEIQAEVDKFLTLAKLLGAQAGGLPERLRVCLFDRVKFSGELDADALRRYQDANRYAGKFCWRLERSLRTARGSQVLRDARRFYRLGQHEKIASLNSA